MSNYLKCRIRKFPICRVQTAPSVLNMIFCGSTAEMVWRRVNLTGRLIDVNGHALANRRFEIWQCDAWARYRHTADPGKANPESNFQEFGHMLRPTRAAIAFERFALLPIRAGRRISTWWCWKANDDCW